MENLREYIRMVIESKNSHPVIASGVIVVKYINNKPKILILRRHDGTYDITKGKIDDGESPFDAAIRETGEEAGIFDLDFIWGMDSITYGKGRLYIAKTTSEPFISVNPETNQREHESLKFVSVDEAERLVDNMLKPGIRWASRKILEKNI
jgi:8-oxo-dGTP pyrophosphatase MutT (NUDIX family)